MSESDRSHEAAQVPTSLPAPGAEPSGGLRRGFFRVCLGGMGVLTAGLTAAPVVTFLRRPLSLSGFSTVSVPESELSGGQAIYREVQGVPVVIIAGEKGPKAFSASCSHLGCIVRWEHEARSFVCPCHGAVFDADGKPLKGPTNQPLAPVSFEVKDGTIVVG